MSHTTEIRSVPIRDVNAFKKAIQTMKDRGVRCDLLENEKPRMYFTHQEAAVGTCDYVLRLHDSRYDVGFKMQEDGTLTPIFDGWADQVRNQIGTAHACPIPSTQEAQDQAQIGALMQEYSKEAAINAATAGGMTVESASQDAQGNWQLVFV